MNDEPLSLIHKDLLYGPLRAMRAQASEYSFANLYLFRSKHDYSVILDKDIFIRGKTYENEAFIMPTRDPRLIDKNILDAMMAAHGMLFPALEEWLGLFQGPEYSITYRDSDSDYIHAIGKLAAYSGNKLHAKKNLLNQFLSLYSCAALPLTIERLPDARAILDAWQNELGISQDETDYGPCAEALRLYEELILCGGIYFIENIPVGFIIGEELDDATFALHFAKGKREYKGLYQFMYNQFARIMPAKYASFNFEQDLGLESLRQSKASYQPEKMVKKYRVSLKKT